MWPFAKKRQAGRVKSRRKAKSLRSPEKFQVRLARMCRRGLWVLFIAALLAGGAWAFDRAQRFVEDSEFFTIDKVDVIGASDELREAAMAAIAPLRESAGDNLVHIDSVQLAFDLEALPRAKAARLEKTWPRTLSVTFDERRPLMIAKVRDFFLMDEEGVLLAAIAPSSLKETGLPVLTGLGNEVWKPGERLRHEELGAVLAAVRYVYDHDPDLHCRIVEWNLGGRGEVKAILRGGAEVRFGRQRPLELLDKLSAALLERPEIENSTYIDLRIDSQIVYK